MQRYTGQSLPANCRVAVVANDAIGNFVVTTPLLSLLRKELRPAEIHYWGGTRTRQLQDPSDLVDSASCYLGLPPQSVMRTALEEGPFDLVVNVEVASWAKGLAAVLAGENGFVCGPCLDSESRADLPYPNDSRGALWQDPDWTSATLVPRYPFLETGHISEIFCRLAYLQGPIPSYSVPSQEPSLAVPDILIASAASGSDKLWPGGKWAQTLSALNSKGLSVGLLGAAPKDQGKYWIGGESENQWVADGLCHDLRGKLTLPQVVGAIANCRCLLSLDNGVLHLGCATPTPVVGLFRHGIHRLWAPRTHNLQVLVPDPDRPVADITSATVLEALRRVL